MFARANIRAVCAVLKPTNEVARLKSLLRISSPRFSLVGRQALADALRHLTHLLVIDRSANEDFHRDGQGNPKIRPVERRAHGLALRGQVTEVFSDVDEQRATLSVTADELRALGTVITLEGTDATYPLKSRRHHDEQKNPM